MEYKFTVNPDNRNLEFIAGDDAFWNEIDKTYNYKHIYAMNDLNRFLYDLRFNHEIDDRFKPVYGEVTNAHCETFTVNDDMYVLLCNVWPDDQQKILSEIVTAFVGDYKNIIKNNKSENTDTKQHYTLTPLYTIEQMQDQLEHFDALNAVFTEFSKHQQYPKRDDITAIMLSDPRSRHVNYKDDNYDLYVFVKDQRENMLRNTSYFKQITINKNIKITIMDFRKLYQEIKNANPNVLQLFACPESLLMLNANNATYRIIAKLTELGSNIGNINLSKYIDDLFLTYLINN